LIRNIEFVFDYFWVLGVVKAFPNFISSNFWVAETNVDLGIGNHEQTRNGKSDKTEAQKQEKDFHYFISRLEIQPIRRILPLLQNLHPSSNSLRKIC
jgi:hypothetical protein